MGVNMRIALVYGVKMEETEYSMECIYKEFDCIYKEDLVGSFGYLDDCYSGKWVFFGSLLEITHDFRYDGWDDFFWNTKVPAKIKKNTKEKLLELGIQTKPEVFVLTYYL